MNQNDDLRNRSGLLSRKEQERLQEENHALVALNADLKCKVNMSNIKAVEDAVNAQKASEAKAKAEIAACNAEASRQVNKLRMSVKKLFTMQSYWPGKQRRNSRLHGELFFLLYYAA